MTEPTLYRYEIIGKNSLFRVNGEDRVEGDVVELTIGQAMEFAPQLKALDPEGEIAPEKKVQLLDRQDYQLSRDHEKLAFLKDREKELNKEMDLIDTEIKAIEARNKAKAAPAKLASVKEEKSKG